MSRYNTTRCPRFIYRLYSPLSFAALKTALKDPTYEILGFSASRTEKVRYSISFLNIYITFRLVAVPCSKRVVPS